MLPVYLAIASTYCCRVYLMLLCGKEPMRLKSGSSFSALESERYYHFSSQRQFFFLVEKMVASASELELVKCCLN